MSAIPAPNPSANNKAACERKVFFSDAAIARQAARQRKRLSGFKLYAYACTECPGWHLTKQVPA